MAALSPYFKNGHYLKGVFWGRGGSVVVSLLAFYSDDPSSNPAGHKNFMLWKDKEN